VLTAKSIKLGISTCLLGEKVRFESGHKLDRFLTDALGQNVEYISVGLEVEGGFGIPPPKNKPNRCHIR
jgi:uncharacterized protein YbbK (DUF523 family)